MKRLLVFLLLVSLVIPENKMVEAEIGRYQLAVSTFTSIKGKVYIVETILDTKTGKIVKRKKIYLSKYKLPYKDGNRIIREE